MFHVELRQFPNVGRSFNLSREELDARILGPWVAERPVALEDRRFSPQKAKLTIYEGPALRPEEIGLGRGWGNVTRSGADVTSRLLDEAKAAPGAAEFKQEIVDRAAAAPVALTELLALASAQNPGRRVSERLALAEQSVWELLHQERVRLLLDGKAVDADQWQPLLLRFESWSSPEVAVQALGL